MNDKEVNAISSKENLSKGERICVVYSSKESYDIFEYLHHFIAEQVNDSTYKIIDWLGRAADVEITKVLFDESFLIIEDKEFEEYERYLNSGYDYRLEDYLNRLCDKYPSIK